MRVVGGTTQPNGWFDAMDSRMYPLLGADSVPRGAIVDLSLATTEAEVWISALTLQDGFASVVLSSPQGVVASVTVESVQPGVIYPLEGELAFGSIVFGVSANSLRLAIAERIDIDPGCVHASLLRQSLIGRYGMQSPATSLSLRGSGDIRVRSGFLDDAETLPAIFIGLDVNQQGDEVHETYLGPCDRRPVANNCLGDTPIQSISSVPPDCCNTIYIEFQGVDIFPLDNVCGVAVVSNGTLAEACPERNLSRIIDLIIEDCEPDADDTNPLPTKGTTGLGSIPDQSGDLARSVLAPGSDPDSEDQPVGTQIYDVFGVVLLYDTLNSVSDEVFKYRDNE